MEARTLQNFFSSLSPSSSSFATLTSLQAMSSAANSQLLSAALTSARHSAARAGAHLPRVVATAPLAGVTSTHAQDDEEDLPLSSRARRRSRASRFGSMSGESETAMPGRLIDATRQWIQGECELRSFVSTPTDTRILQTYPNPSNTTATSSEALILIFSVQTQQYAMQSSPRYCLT